MRRKVRAIGFFQLNFNRIFFHWNHKQIVGKSIQFSKSRHRGAIVEASENLDRSCRIKTASTMFPIWAMYPKWVQAKPHRFKQFSIAEQTFPRSQCIVDVQEQEPLFDTSDLKSLKSELELSPLPQASLEISLQYDAPMRKMTVHVLQARGVPSKGKATTHSQVRLLILPTKKQKHKTKIRSGENPQFMERWEKLFLRSSAVRKWKFFPHSVTCCIGLILRRWTRWACGFDSTDANECGADW